MTDRMAAVWFILECYAPIKRSLRPCQHHHHRQHHNNNKTTNHNDDDDDDDDVNVHKQVLWSDEVADTPVPSTRQFINTFLVGGGTDENGEAFGPEDATALSRLPYDRVSINGSSPATFVSNDVVRECLRATFFEKAFLCATPTPARTPPFAGLFRGVRTQQSWVCLLNFPARDWCSKKCCRQTGWRRKKGTCPLMPPNTPGGLKLSRASTDRDRFYFEVDCGHPDM